MQPELHILHVFSTFASAGPQLRMTAIMNALGPALSHTVMAIDGNFDAAHKLDSRARVTLVPPPPKESIWTYAVPLRKAIGKIRPDLMVTYNWGAMDAVIGTVLHPLCPVLHHEHGFGPDEALRLHRRRVILRRLLLNRIHRTLVPSKRLLDIALTQYRIRPEKVRYIANGVDVERFRPRRNHDLRRQWAVADGEVLFGYVGQLREEKNLSLLIRAFAMAGLDNARLVFVGDGECRRELEELVRDLAIMDRVIFAGNVLDPAPCFGALDAFVMSSTSEQMPMSLLEAMASGLPALGTDVGDLRQMLGNPGTPALVPSADLEAYTGSLRSLAVSETSAGRSDRKTASAA